MPLTGHQLLASDVLEGRLLAAASATELALVCAGATLVLLAVLSLLLRREEVLRAA